MHIYSRYKSYKNPPFLTKQRVFLVRPMRFERTAFGVGAGLSIDFPCIFRRKSSESTQNQTFYTAFAPTNTMRQEWCGRQNGRQIILWQREGLQAYWEAPVKIIRGGVVQRFEFTCELAWKATRLRRGSMNRSARNISV